MADIRAVRPSNITRLSEAHQYISAVIAENPKAGTLVNPRWIGRLQEARAADLTDCTDDSPDEAEIWHADRCANLILREALSLAALSAYAGNKNTGEVVKLGPSNWISGERNPMPELPPPLYDYLPADDDRLPILQSTNKNDDEQPIFLLTDEFDNWLRKIFGRWLDTSVNLEGTQDRAHKLEAAKIAIRALWGRNAPPAGILVGTRTKLINDWLVKNERDKVSFMTIKRALKAMHGTDRS